MDAHTYPGKGLSLSQLVFALNEELKRMSHSPLFTLEAVSQLDRDTLRALAAIREWKNSFALINRIPTDILSLIPTHLTSQKDLFHTASVCRHWRRVLLENGALWSQLFLIKGEDYLSTLLERAKGSALDIVADHRAPASSLTLISSRAQQIRSLEFTKSYWRDIITFSESNSGRLPLIRILKISTLDPYIVDGQPNVVTPPPLPFFRGSINLKRFVFHSGMISLLNHFVFPNLTTFELSTHQAEVCSALHLLEFLKASPMLQTVEVKVPPVTLRGVPREMVVVLPNVETFSLYVAPTTRVYDIAAHISCPCARYASLTHGMYDTHMGADVIFPAPVSWNAIIHQYTASPIEEVTLDVEDLECFLTFQSSDTTMVRVNFEVIQFGVHESLLDMSHEEMGWSIFCAALETIQDRPLLSHVKRLHIKYNESMSNPYDKGCWMIEGVRDLFNSLEPLDELIIDGCDLRIFLAEFLADLGLNDPERPIVFPHIKQLTILLPSRNTDDTRCMAAIVELAKSQHALGIPFERVKLRVWDNPGGMAEKLRRWVTGTVVCRHVMEPWPSEFGGV